MLDLSFGEDGELINIARVDAVINFIGSYCDGVEGSFTLMFFDIGQDPLNPDDSNGVTILGAFIGTSVKPD